MEPLFVVSPDGEVHEFTTVEQARAYADAVGGVWVAYRRTTCAQGSWKWQKAYAVHEYRLVKLKNGRVVWRSYRHVTSKLSEPQLRRTEWKDLPYGSLHNKPAEAVFV